MGQEAGFAGHFRRAVVSANPQAQVFALMPAGVIPDHHHQAFLFLTGNGQQTHNEQPHLDTVGLSLAQRQQNLARVLTHGPKTGQRLGYLARARLTLNQLERMVGQCPGLGLRLNKAREPALIFIYQQPVRVLESLLL